LVPKSGTQIPVRHYPAAIEDSNMAHSKRFDYQRSDVQIRVVAWTAAGLATFVVVAPLVLPLIFPQSMSHATPASRPAHSSNAPPLEVAPQDALQKSRRDEAETGRTYGWVDHDRGIVRIPTVRAVEILLHRGLPGWPSP
jgi:hypothetical protein